MTKMWLSGCEGGVSTGEGHGGTAGRRAVAAAMLGAPLGVRPCVPGYPSGNSLTNPHF